MNQLCKSICSLIFFLLVIPVEGQEYPTEKSVSIFENVPINFNGETGDTLSVNRLQSGRLVFKKVTVPIFDKGTDVSIKMRLRSNGDPWDKSGSCFVVTDPKQIDIIDISKGKEKFPAASGVNGDYLGVLNSGSYQPPVELLRFMTPFGVGHFSDEEKYPRIKYNRPVYVPKWENEVVWENDISELESLITGTFYIGIWIDTWTAEGYLVDLSLEYSGRTRPKLKVVPLVNSIYYVDGQKIPDLFAKTTLDVDFLLKKKYSNASIYYTTTGHGGHSGGDEFIQLKNEVYLDKKKILDTIPWRDDCSSFRRFNPSSGVWTKKDSAFAYNENNEREYKEIEERLASSDLSRSNWCPGSFVKPYRVKLDDLEKGNHQLTLKIPATLNKGDQLNHWLVSAYLVYKE